MNGVLIVFRLPKNTEHKVLNLFTQRFYGQESSSWNKKYKYHRHGILEDIAHIKLIRGVLIVKRVDLKKVIDFLKEYNAEVYVREIKLTFADTKILYGDKK
jgi:hypothetical protein